jgi:hypothetical protein
MHAEHHENLEWWRKTPHILDLDLKYTSVTVSRSADISPAVYGMWGYSGYRCEVKIPKLCKGLLAQITTELEKSLDTRNQICFNIYITGLGRA